MALWTIGLWNNKGGSGNTTFANITGSPYDNTELANALNAKFSKLTSASVQTVNFNALVSRIYPVDTTAGAVTATLPISSSNLDGEIIFIYDYEKKSETNNIIINNSEGVEIERIQVNGGNTAVIYSESSSSWIKFFENGNITLASETRDGLMSFGDFTKLLWSTSDNDIHKQNFTSNNYNIPKEIITTTAYITQDNQTMTLPDLSTDPNKTSFDYQKDTYQISNHPNSKFSVLIKFARDIIDIDGSVILGSIGISLPIGTSTVFKWWQIYEVRDVNGNLTGITYNNVFERIS